MIIPSIDIVGGSAVKLEKGRKILLNLGNPLLLAAEYAKYGTFTVIDIDGAKGIGDNSEMIAKICKNYSCNIGGGIRSVPKARFFLRAGARKIIVSTNASRDFLSNFNRDQLTVAIELAEGNIMVDGWQTQSEISAADLIKNTEDLTSAYLVTAIDNEGMGKGIDKSLLDFCRSLTGRQIIYAGGVSSYEEVQYLNDIGVDCQVGLALYDGRLSLSDAFVRCLKFAGQDGLIPAIIVDRIHGVQMLGYMNREALLKTLETGYVHFWSRSRNCIWQKGATSGNYLYLDSIFPDCDHDTLLVNVNSSGPVCHKGSQTCFNVSNFSLAQLMKRIQERVAQKTSSSYSYYLSENKEYLHSKIREEFEELLHFTSRENLVHEVSDVLYHVFSLLVANDIGLKEIIDELYSRAGN